MDIIVPYFVSLAGQRKLDRFDGDMRQAMQIHHDNSVAVYGYMRKPVNNGQSDGWQLFIVTEPLPVLRLRQILQVSGKLSMEKAIPLFSQCAELLAYLHNLDILHRCKSTTERPDLQFG